jgi:hypothetical protein
MVAFKHGVVVGGKVSGPIILGGSIAAVLALFWAVRRTGSWLRRLRDIEPRLDRRRAPRVPLSTPVLVYGWLQAQTFWENTETLDVSAIGGSMPLSVSVVRSQGLIITNLVSNEDVRCSVARFAKTSDGKAAIGFEFAQASAGFWRIEELSRQATAADKSPLGR